MAARALMKNLIPLGSSLRSVKRHGQTSIYSSISGNKTSKYRYSTEAEVELDQRVQITDNCVKQLNKVCREGEALRLFVEGGGCSGFQYKFELDNEIAEDDKLFEREGAKVVIDKESLQFLNGASIDYETELIRSAFHVVNNPNAEKGCSCGVSFTLKI